MERKGKEGSYPNGLPDIPEGSGCRSCWEGRTSWVFLGWVEVVPKGGGDFWVKRDFVDCSPLQGKREIT
jgi:hypothetical protein